MERSRVTRKEGAARVRHAVLGAAGVGEDAHEWAVPDAGACETSAVAPHKLAQRMGRIWSMPPTLKGTNARPGGGFPIGDVSLAVEKRMKGLAVGFDHLSFDGKVVSKLTLEKSSI